MKALLKKLQKTCLRGKPLPVRVSGTLDANVSGSYIPVLSSFNLGSEHVGDMCPPLAEPERTSGGITLPESERKDSEDSVRNRGKRKALEEACNVLKKLLKTDNSTPERCRSLLHNITKTWRSGPRSGSFMDTVSYTRATWVKRFPSDDDVLNDRANPSLTETQKEKLSHFFSHVFDMDRDDIISVQDFESFSERVRHFSDWSTNSGDYLVLEQVQQGFIETFIHPLKPDTSSEAEGSPPIDINKLFLSIEDWLWFWGVLLEGIKSYHELPIWLQYFPKVIFNAINKSGSGVITRDELSAFYSSVMGFSAQRVGEMLDKAYRAMTANGDYKLNYSLYRLCFANFLLGRFPNGPGQYVFGCAIKEPATFPIDYTAMNAKPEDLECFNLLERASSNRSSIIV
ncbi:uncharacterized protein Scp2 isoform X1 [Halyomorpha halys]|uniref:uncharacterized protein Scp2 isoform X1 n=1 Tax=Halyomorpha halys TaxID=286706 RepID=UPI0006D51126|nr:uncharacterized protein LOC106683165 isoform X1 [Halyomorpha halys]